MNAEDVMNMVENGKAYLIYTDLLIAKAEDGIYVSLDGNEWEKAKEKIFTDEFDK